MQFFRLIFEKINVVQLLTNLNCKPVEKLGTASNSYPHSFFLDKARLSIVENYKLTCTENSFASAPAHSNGEKCEVYEIEWVRANFKRCSLMPLLLLLPMIIFITAEVGSWRVIFMILNLDCGSC